MEALAQETYRITVGEQKFRSMVNDLMVMENPSMTIEAPSQSKARSLRRMFYSWRDNLTEMEKNFMTHFEFKLVGRTISVERKVNWVPKETGDSQDVSPDQTKST